MLIFLFNFLKRTHVLHGGTFAFDVRWIESDSFDIGLSMVLKHEKYSIAPKKWTYKLFMGVKSLFIITWIRIQKIKTK